MMKLVLLQRISLMKAALFMLVCDFYKLKIKFIGIFLYLFLNLFNFKVSLIFRVQFTFIFLVNIFLS
jgi:hypothetical protein